MTTPGRDDLARTIRRLVEAGRISPAETSRRMGVSEATVSRYLNGKIVPTPNAVAALVAATGQDGTEAATEALQLAEDLRTGRVVLLRPGTATQQRRYAEIEQAAEHVGSYGALIVPGLLQTERYAHAVFHQRGAEQTDRSTANLRERIDRRQALLDSPAHRFTQLTTEGALRWHVGSPDLMAEQLGHLAHRAAIDTGGRVRIGVIPTSTPVDLFPMTNFELYDDGRAVIIGTNFGTNFLASVADVRVYADLFHRLCELATFDAVAVPIFRRIGDDYRRMIDA